MRRYRVVITMLCALAACGVLAGPAGASGSLVQQGQSGPVINAHRYTADTTQRLAVSTDGSRPLDTYTLLDFDRDGRPDAMVELRGDGQNSSGVDQVLVNTFRVNRSAYDPSTHCFVRIGSGNDATSTIKLLDQQTTIYSTAGGRRDVDVNVPLQADFGDIARFQPVMVTFSADPSSLNSPVTDVLPDAAGTGASCTAPDPFGPGVADGKTIDMSKGTDRGQPATPARVQDMVDLTDGDPADTDVLDTQIDSYDGAPSAGTQIGSLYGTQSTHPADLVLRLASGDGTSGMETATYLLPGYTTSDLASQSGANTAVMGMVTTSPSVDADHVTVTVYDTVTDTKAVNGVICEPFDGEGRSATRLQFDLPLQRTLEGNAIVRIPLDRLLDVFQDDGSSEITSFRWVTTGLHAGTIAAPDYVPDTAARSASGAALTRCDPSTGTAGPGAGTQLDPRTMPRFALALPSAALTASPASPARNAPVDFTASGGTAYAFDLTGSGTFRTETDGTPATAANAAGYATPAVARVMVTDADGTAAMAARTVAPVNTNPDAVIAPLAASYALSAGTARVTFDGSGSDDPDRVSSGNGIAAYAWKLFLGTGSTPVAAGTGATFARDITTTGSYRIELTVTDADGGTGTSSATFRVVHPPAPALASTDPDPVIAGRDATLHAATAAANGDDGPLHYAWDLDHDGSYETSTGTTPSVTTRFASRGTRMVGLQVTDAASRTGTAGLDVVVRSLDETPPTAALSATVAGQPAPPATARSGEDDVTFSAVGSVLNSPGGATGTPDAYRYDFGDGSAPVSTDQASVTHRYAGSGHYTATLTVIDDRISPPSESTPATLDVTVTQGATDANAPAVTLAGPRTPVYANRDATFTAASTVKDGPAHYAWDLDGDGTFEHDTGTQSTLTTSWPSAGARDVRVRVTDAQGRTAVSAPLTVNVRTEPVLAPSMTLSAPDTVQIDNGPATVTLDATGSTGRNDDKSLTYAWDLDGDGMFERGTGSTPRTTVTFASRGARTVRVRGTDSYGNTATATREILVKDATDAAAGCTGGASYRTISFGPARAAACWTRVDRPSAGPLWIAAGRVDMNGLVLTGAHGSTQVHHDFADCDAAPCTTANAAFNDVANGVALAFDPHDGRLVSNAPIAISAAGSGINLPLSLSPLDVTLPAAASDDGFILRVPDAAKLFGFPVTGEAEVRFPSAGTTQVNLTVSMPEGLPGVSGETQVTATPARGVVLDRLKVDVGTGEFGGALLVRQLGFEYDRAEALWAGSAKLTIPAGKPVDLAIDVAVQDGRFKSIHGEVDGLNQPLAEAIFLQRVAAGVAVNPLDLSGGMGITAGPKIGEESLVRADADFRMLFPGAGSPYHVFQLTGSASLLGEMPLARAFIQFSDSGFVEARGAVGGDYDIAYFDASVGGWISASAADFSGDAEAGLEISGRKVALVGAHAVVSTVGVAACGEIPVIDLGGGLGAKWSNFKVATFHGCDLGPYSVDRPADAPAMPAGFARAAAAPARRGHVVVLPSGLRSAALEVRAAGAEAPRFRVIDAHGRTVLSAAAEHLTPASMVVQDDRHGIASALWKAPRAGRYWVVAERGSPRVTRVKSALGTPPPVVHAAVTGRGEVRTLRWNVLPRLQRGQRLVLAETSAGAGGRELVSTSRSAGSLRFHPVAGLAAGRAIQATILTEGLGDAPVTVARFTPPALRAPGRPARLDLRRRGRTVRARWRPARGGTRAARYRVEARIGTARRSLGDVAGSRRTFVLRNIPAALPVRVAVRGLAVSAGDPGGARRALVRAGRLRSGRLAALAAAPRHLRAVRSGRSLVVRWRRGPEPVRRFEVRIHRPGRRTIVLGVHPDRFSVTVRHAPAGRLRIEVRALRMTGRAMVRHVTAR